MQNIATAKAHANIGIVKYWGKRDDVRILPHTDSLSITLEPLFTITTVEFQPHFKTDHIFLNKQEVNSNQRRQRVVDHLDYLRHQASTSMKAVVKTENSFPTQAGLASSASGYMALTLAAAAALDLPPARKPLDCKTLSLMARRGSGSACRSAYGGFVLWHRGTSPEGEDAFAECLFPQNVWPELRILAVLVSHDEKHIPSREAMALTVKTCPFYKMWPTVVKEDIQLLHEAIAEQDLKGMGTIAERQTLMLHALTQTTSPPILYWHPSTVAVIHQILALRDEGIPCYFTIDAGPNPFILCTDINVERITSRLQEILTGIEVIQCRVGPGPTLCT